ncbi:hypothetical protein JJL45_09150 [Tamlana sp. s12]|uniref:hypothetical protein n=1 Tax=Tamlana sp. s12 TaxID=1630406 RepID=UPI0007FCDAE2|nr:hypothetical protein [Tamlana sp. s12]OBQ52877.1 hypothetical protein VQ01_13090 [Tamlana sp. s12]QQY81096.1 hypothetical protein JJL45_09150 [Tamlana sp. s12]
MSNFIPFSETSCETFEMLKMKGVLADSDYMQSLKASCDQKNAPAPSATADQTKSNRIKIIGAAAFVAAIAIIIIIKKKKHDS